MEIDNEESKLCNNIVCTRQKIFLYIQDEWHSSITDQIQLLEKTFARMKSCPFEISKNSKEKLLKPLIHKMKTKWNDANRTLERFYQNNTTWLEQNVTVENALHKVMNEKGSSSSVSTFSTSTMGRPSKDFLSSCDASKRRKVKELRESTSTEELAFAAEMNLRASGSHAAAKVVKDVTSTTPTRASRYISALQATCGPRPKETSADIALNLIIKCKISRDAYNSFREVVNGNRDVSVLPSYYKVQAAKKRTYPPQNTISVTETSAVVTLQALLDHTASRLLEVQADVIQSLDESITRNITLFLKWGFDGSSGAKYKQKFSESDSSDENVLLTSIVPLRLRSLDEETNDEILIWNNPRPSSTRYCRPLHLQFAKETVESTLAEKECFEKQVAALTSFNTVFRDRNIEVHYQLCLTMIDGKVRNAITNIKATQKCYICELTSKNFNNLDLISQTPGNPERLRFGIASLHAWIRFMEWFLHIAYRVDEGKWQARSAEEKKNVAIRKAQIQAEFKRVLGLNIDTPRQGSGNTNDGNTARRFFDNVSLTSKIVNIDEQLIANCKVILQTISCGFAVNVEKFKTYCSNVAKQYVELYSWYPMPTSVHIVFAHGAEIIEQAPLPIGQLSEDAQEARNKDIRRYRENFARKCTREQTMFDMFHRLLASSDPLITSLDKIKIKDSKPLPSEVINLLLPITNLETNESLIETDPEVCHDNDYDF